MFHVRKPAMEPAPVSITPILPPLPPIDLDAVDPAHADLPYEERLLEAMTPRMKVLLSIGRAAYIAKLAEVGDRGTCGFASVVLEITPKTKPFIRWLNEEDCGRIDGWALNFKVSPNDFLKEGDRQVQSLTVQEAGCEALAAALRDSGCPCRVESRVD